MPTKADIEAAIEAGDPFLARDIAQEVLEKNGGRGLSGHDTQIFIHQIEQLEQQKGIRRMVQPAVETETETEETDGAEEETEEETPEEEEAEEGAETPEVEAEPEPEATVRASRARTVGR